MYNLSVFEKILTRKKTYKDEQINIVDVREKMKVLIKKLTEDQEKLNDSVINDLFNDILVFNNSLVKEDNIYSTPIIIEYNRLLKLSEDKDYYFSDDDFIHLEKILENRLTDNYISTDLREEIDNFLKSLNVVAKDVKVEIFFEIIKNKKIKIFSLKNENQSSSFSEYFAISKLDNFETPILLKEKEKKILLKDSFFYSLAINYSFYALNSLELGRWLRNIFHKNDSYQMPIVLNPMRTEGFININTESDLTNSRFLHNLFYPLIFDKKIEPNEINGKRPFFLKLKLNHTKLIPRLVKGRADFVGFALFKKYTEYIPIIDEVFDIDAVSIKTEIKEVCYEYILNKIYNIVDYYKSYDSKEYLMVFKGNENKKFKELLFKIKSEDNSHITLKLKQAINFLKYYQKAIPQIDNLSILKDEFEINIVGYAKLISNTENFEKENFSQFLLPSFFDYNLIFEDGSDFSQLSSGEKQFIHATNTILYHLLNIVSVHRNTDDKLNKYRYVNMIYDEIELYYHPDLQIKFLNHLLTEIKKLNLKNIDGINILLITHSPFILSDIPKQNILFLDNGKPQDYKRMNTFGANITDLLSDSFFINDGLMGDFAKVKIEDTIKWINLQKHKRDSKLQEPYRLNVEQFNFHKQIIVLIDEPVLRMKLAEMIDELKEGKAFQKELALKEIEYLRSKYRL